MKQAETVDTFPFVTAQENRIQCNRRLTTDYRSRLSREEWVVIGDHLQLTPRELQVVYGLSCGATAGTVALKLGISVNTIHAHEARLHRKLGVHNAAGIVARVLSTYADWAHGSTSAGVLARSLSE